MSTQEDDVLFVDPISWAYPVGYNANVNNEDGDINNTQTKKTGSSRARSSRKSRGPKRIPDKWVGNWNIEERPRADGRIDKLYHHKKDKVTPSKRKKDNRVTCRSIDAVLRYETEKLNATNTCRIEDA